MKCLREIKGHEREQQEKLDALLPLPPLRDALSSVHFPLSCKPIIAIDVDEVLGFFLSPLLDFYYAMNYGNGKRYTLEDMHSYHFSDVWQHSEAATNEIVMRYFDSPFFDDLPTVPFAAPVLRRLKKYFHFVVITARQTILEEKTRLWIGKHYEGIFDQILFGNHYGSGKKFTKKELCESVGAEALVDDSILYCAQAAPALDCAILFDFHGRYGWNKEHILRKQKENKLPKNVLRRYSWMEVEITLLQRFGTKIAQRNQNCSSSSSSSTSSSDCCCSSSSSSESS